MSKWYVCDGDCEYYLSDVVLSGYKIDVTQKFVDRYIAYEAEREFIQSKLHRYFNDAKERKQLEECQKGIPSHGF